MINDAVRAARINRETVGLPAVLDVDEFTTRLQRLELLNVDGTDSEYIEEQGELIDALLVALDTVRKSHGEILEVLDDVIHQACWVPDEKILDSMALSAYADGLRVLGDWGQVKITASVGRRVIAERIEQNTARDEHGGLRTEVQDAGEAGPGGSPEEPAGGGAGDA